MGHKRFRTGLWSLVSFMLAAAIIVLPSLTGQVAATGGVGLDSAIVSILDPNLEEAIRDALGKPADPITEADMESITYLYATYKNITDLTGLEYAVNLETLNLSGNQLTDVSPLSELYSLISLSLGSNQLADISPLSGLVNLNGLDLDYNMLTDISPLSGLVNLSYLNLSDNQLTDISPLSELDSLLCLYLDSNQLTDILPLSGLVNLSILGIGYNMLTDISPLSGLDSLFHLYLDGNQLTDISPLSGLANLWDLCLSDNQLTDISPLSGLVNLRSLGLVNNQLANISPLSGLVNLSYLNLSDNQLTDVSPLSGLNNLSELSLYNNYLSEISFSGLVNLRYLSLGDNQLTSITLSGLNNLSDLYLYNNYLSEISFSGLVNLSYLNLSDNQLTDISPLSVLVNLNRVDLSRNLIAEVPDLSHLPLEGLILDENQLTDISNLLLLRDLDLYLRYNNLDTGPGSQLMELVGNAEGNNVKLVWFPQKKDAKGAICGLITADDGGLPIAQAYVEAYMETDVYDSVYGFAYSDLEGRYRIELPAIASYKISVSADGYISVSRGNIEVEDGRDTVVDLALRNVNEVVHIPDCNLETAIAEALNKPAGSITYADLKDLYELNAEKRNIRDLTGLEYADNLRELVLNNNQIYDISPLSSLSLDKLELAGNQISDISALPHISHFGLLDLRSNYLDVSAGSPVLNVINNMIGQQVMVRYEPQSIMEFQTEETSPGEYTATLEFKQTSTTVEISSVVELSASIYLNRYDQYHIEDPVAAIPAGIYLHMGREGDLQGATVTIKVSYDPGNLPGGMDETSLRLKRYNEGQGVWEEMLPQGVNTKEKYIWAEVSDFSVFGVFADMQMLYGDVNGDSFINVGDAILVLRSIVGLASFEPYQALIADVNGDGNVNVGDAILILRYIVGLIDRFPVEGPLP